LCFEKIDTSGYGLNIPSHICARWRADHSRKFSGASHTLIQPLSTAHYLPGLSSSVADAYPSTVPDWRALLFDRTGSLARAGNVYDVIALPVRDIFMFIPKGLFTCSLDAFFLRIKAC
jgi:hypothetical protein